MIYLLLGIAVGALSGLLGIGGGILMAPSLLFIFQHQLLFTHHMTQIAAGSSLAVITFTSLSSLLAYQQRKSIDWNLVKQLLPGAVCGALIGVFTATLVSSQFLAYFLGIFIWVMAIQMLLPPSTRYQHKLPNRGGLVLIGLLVGMIGGLVGVGGGILLIPILSYYQVPLRLCSGTVIACTFFVALSGTLSLTIIPSLFSQTGSSYIFWPAVWQIVPTSIVFAWIGTFIAHRLPVVLLKKIFAVFLALIGSYLIFAH